MRSLAFILGLIFVFSVQAKNIKQLEAEGLVIREGTVLEVQSFDSKSKTFELMIVKEPGVGPNVATAKNLVNSTGVTFDKLKDQIGSEITLKKKLILLSNEEIEKIK